MIEHVDVSLTKMAGIIETEYRVPRFSPFECIQAAIILPDERKTFKAQS